MYFEVNIITASLSACSSVLFAQPVVKQSPMKIRKIEGKIQLRYFKGKHIYWTIFTSYCVLNKHVWRRKSKNYQKEVKSTYYDHGLSLTRAPATNLLIPICEARSLRGAQNSYTSAQPNAILIHSLRSLSQLVSHPGRCKLFVTTQALLNGSVGLLF